MIVVSDATSAQGKWVEIKVISHRDKFQELQDVYGLGEGEAAAIILSQELKANFFFTDDRLARKVAPNFLQGTSTIVSGTIGILKSAKVKLLPYVTPSRNKCSMVA
ncbi:MAG: hypothetical protein A2035_07940 [Nitrospirae bacterium GWA2_42_11]|nr:MAG: hypothetical protein A2035_07940 [Nitrospirae bacterium GWA2_42_11]